MRPVSYAEEFINDWSAWVLEHGVPSPLHEPSVGESVPIARHVGRNIGAVLHLGWLSSDEPDDEPVLVCDVDVLVLTAEGWLSTGAGGGSGWFTPPLQRPPDIASTGVMVMGWHASAEPDLGMLRCVRHRRERDRRHAARR